MKQHILASLALSGLALALPAAQAQTQTPPATGAQALYTRSLAATCANCHGTDGRAAPGASLASLAGQDKAFLVKQMTDFKSGARPATVMHQISKGYNDAQIDAIAAYFAAQKK